MSGIGDIVSGITGLAKGGQQFFQPVQQAGGITPFEEDFANYGYQENLLADRSQFAGSGTGDSTMATQAAGGARIGKAETEGQISDTNAQAILSAIRIGEGAQATANTQGQTDLSTLANAFGSQNQNNGFVSGFNNPPTG